MLIGLAMMLAAQEAAPPVPPAAKPPRTICRRAPAETGSMMPGPRTRHTIAEWHEIDRPVDDAGGVSAPPPPGMSMGAGISH